MSKPTDPRLLLLALSAFRLMQAIKHGDMSIDAPEDKQARAAALLDLLELRISQALSFYDNAEAAMKRADAADRLAHRLLDPEDLGFSANAHIRDAARVALGITPIETIDSVRTAA